MIETTICILGAGPGGVAAALQLDRLGIPCILLDKAYFPRDKVCGDALSGKAVWAFNRIDEAIFNDFRFNEEAKIPCWGIHFYFENKRSLSFAFKPKIEQVDLSKEKPLGYVSKRLDFDHFLIKKVKESKHIRLIEGVDYQKVSEEKDGLRISGKNAEDLKAQLLIVANGATSHIARQLGGLQIDKKHYCGAVRAYMKGVKNFNDYNFIEIHFLKDFMPGYLWIFPLANGQANVGVGMRSDHISQKRINLTQSLKKILKTDERFKERFAEATFEGPLKGFPLPLGSKKRTLSGNRFMLVGDAASLIDPLTGEGIGNAATSGFLAARHAKKALEGQNFTAQNFKAYDKEVYQYLWKELRISHQLQKAFNYPVLVQIIAAIAGRNKRFMEMVTSMFTDVDVRKKLLSPKFYFQLLFNR